MFRRTAFLWAILIPLASLAAPATTAAQGRRPLAPGVLSVIPPEPMRGETTVGPLSLKNNFRLDWDPNFAPKSETLREQAASIQIRHNIWNLEFAFKPLRMIHVDIPQVSGKMQRKLIWYMVYRVRNNGGHLHPVPVEDKYGHTTFDTGKADAVLNYGAAQPEATIRFFPHFVLESREVGKAYLDRLIPVAIPAIQARETKNLTKLYNSVDITKIPIPVSKPGEERSVWGVATWEDVDPRIDYFSIYVQGLTNAFQFERSAEGKLVHQQKTLQLNFWRPGDVVFENESEIRFGVPAEEDALEQAHILRKYSNLNERLDYLWVYR